MTAGRLVIRQLLTGHLVAEEAVDFPAPNVGIYPLQIRWLAEDGSEVEAGDRVVGFDNTSLTNQHEQLESRIDQSSTELETAVSRAATSVAEVRFELLQKEAELERARIEADVPENLKSELEYARLQLDLDKALLEIRQAERKLESVRRSSLNEVDLARGGLEKALRARATVERKIEQLELRAPRAGTVILQQNWAEDRIFQSGDNTQPGMTIARIPDLSTLVVRAQLYDVDDGRIEVGLPAEIVLDAYPEEVLHGKVREIDQVAQQPSRRSLRRVFGVTVELDAEHEREGLLPGMSARVVVERSVAASGAGGADVLVPRAALDLSDPRAPRAQRAGGSWAEVELGACNSTHCLVSSGLDAGDRVKPLYSGRIGSAPP